MKTIPIESQAVVIDKPAGLLIYFRDVNRIHINRFKAYNQVLSHRLNNIWHVTDDINQAHAVATYKNNQTKEQEATMTLSLLSRSKQQTKVFDRIELGLKEKQLIKHLNQASRKIKLANHETATASSANTQSIKICGQINQSLSGICQQLNSLRDTAAFKTANDLFSDQSVIFIDHLMLLVDPQSSTSVNEFTRIDHAMKADELTINHLTVVILDNQNSQQHEQVFDDIYAQCNDTTHVTTLDIGNDQELKNFVRFF